MSFLSYIWKELLGLLVAILSLVESFFQFLTGSLGRFLARVITASFPPLGLLGPVAATLTIGLSIAAGLAAFSLTSGEKDVTEDI